MALNYILESLSLNVIEKLLSTTSSFGEKQLLPCGDMQEEVVRLQQNLAKIKDFFTEIENEGASIDQNKSLQSWLWQFRDAVEEAEDVLDELEYNEIEKKVQVEDDKVNSMFSRYKRKFTDFIAGPFKDETFKRLKEAVKKLDNVAAGKDSFLLLAHGMIRGNGKHQEQWKLLRSCETSAFSTERKLFGREKEKMQVINWLTKPASNKSTDSNVSTFTLVGLGGMGKTTLAQIVYGDEIVRKHFELLMWVHVSNKFDTITITKKLLEAANMSSWSEKLKELQKTLKEKLESKRFFLILDDVWNDNDGPEWETLIEPLKFGSKGSKILVTTRMQSVAEMVSKQTNQEAEWLKLDGLEEKDFLLLFNSHAFASVDPEKYKDLQLIGKQIAKKLGGCPLTAKVMGGQLNWYMDEYYWEKILKEDFINIDQGENGIMSILKLSYSHLPTCLQLCFRYCAIFPENYVFDKDELIYMWLNSGLIHSGDQKPEEVGCEYFGHLLKRSFFEFKMSYDHSTGLAQIGNHKPMNILGKQYMEHLLQNSSFYFRDTYYSSASYYVMHDLLRDLARSVSLGECQSIGRNDFQYIPKTLRHVHVFTEVRNDSLLKEISQLRHLRSLVIVFKGNDPQQNHVQLLSEILRGSKCLRLLSIITGFSCKLPVEIGNLIHLRHLSITQITADSKLNWFPESVCKLYNLRVMILLGQSESDNDYEDINASTLSNLINLRQLRIPDTIMIKIPEFGKLRSLQGSIAFDVRKEKGYRIGELKNMADISSLSLGALENVRNPKEANIAKLLEKKYLRSLYLLWSRNSSRSSERDSQLIDNLEPCAKLIDLAIQGYNGICSPCWMADLSLFNLTSISLLDCINWENLPALGELPNLKILELNRMWAVKRIDDTFYGKADCGSFPSLKELKFNDLLRWELWIGLNDGLSFPQLDSLTVEKSPKLREFPPLPPSTNRLHINNAGLVSLSALFQVSTFGEDAASSLTSAISQQRGNFSLEVLSIKRCENLMHLPKRDLEN